MKNFKDIPQLFLNNVFTPFLTIFDYLLIKNCALKAFELFCKIIKKNGVHNFRKGFCLMYTYGCLNVKKTLKDAFAHNKFRENLIY